MTVLNKRAKQKISTFLICFRTKDLYVKILMITAFVPGNNYGLQNGHHKWNITALKEYQENRLIRKSIYNKKIE